MGLLQDLKSQYRRVSIVGMAKNAGKTTALNFLIEEAMDEGMTLGITSTGRDGENTDLVTGTDKPRVYLDQGTIVTVPKGLYELAGAGLEILTMTYYRTSLGQIMICKVAESGYVQVAGPVTTAAQKAVCEDMLDMGAEMVIIDGAIDRKSIAAPETSDAIIISTGAVLSRNMKKVVEETAHMIGLYRLPCLDDTHSELRERAKNLKTPLVINREDEVTPQVRTGLGAGRVLDGVIGDDTEYVFIPGAFTESVVADIATKKLRTVTFIVKDPTKIFIDSVTWQQLVKKGLKVKLLEGIKVAAITVNPVAPAGYAFDHRELAEAMQRAVPDIPVIDVRL